MVLQENLSILLQQCQWFLDQMYFTKDTKPDGLSPWFCLSLEPKSDASHWSQILAKSFFIGSTCDVFKKTISTYHLNQNQAVGLSLAILPHNFLNSLTLLCMFVPVIVGKLRTFKDILANNVPWIGLVKHKTSMLCDEIVIFLNVCQNMPKNASGILHIINVTHESIWMKIPKKFIVSLG